MSRAVSLTLVLLATGVPTLGCGNTSSPASASDAATPPAHDPVFGGSRPVSLYVPPSYVRGTPMPLVIMLHGYGATGAIEEAYLQLQPLAESRGFLYAHPDGTKDSSGNQFWNATNACCNLYGSTVDDSAYLSSLVTEIAAAYTVDPKQVYFTGHSNGGFMAHRMACDHADQIAAIASLAGAMWLDTSKCAPSAPVSVLEIHGTADMTIDYDGGTILGSDGGAIAGDVYPGAVTTIGDWVKLDGCSSTADTSSPPLDLDNALAGNETKVTTYTAGCKPGGEARLWSVVGGGHILSLSTTFASDLVGFLLAHPRP